MPKPKPQATPAPSAPQKEVITPEQTTPASALSTHSHIGFIVAIVVAAVLAIGVSVLAYMTYSKGNTTFSRLIEVQNQNTSLSTQIGQLQQDLDNAPEPVPYFYTSPTELPRELEQGALHSVDPITGEDTIIVNFPEGQYYEVLAQPRRDWDGRIFLKKIMQAPNLAVFSLNVNSGTELVAIDINEDLPVLSSAVKISPDETTLAAVYDNPQDPESIEFGQVVRNVVFWNLLTGDRYAPEIGDDFFFAEAYDGPAGATGIDVRWISDTCIQAAIFTQDYTEAGDAIYPRPQFGYGNYCDTPLIEKPTL
jgi:hypothetical protein